MHLPSVKTQVPYQRLLKWAIYPTVAFFLFSFVSLALTVHYWILGDWIVPRDITVTTKDIDQRTGRPITDDTVVYFTDRDTDVTISSGILCFSAAIVALVAWTSLRKPNMDSQFAAGKRRFMVLAVIVMTAAGSMTALASLILHYTERGSNEFGCASERLMMAGKMNSNQFCTRELAACNFQYRYLKGTDKNNASLACNETVAVKWLQIILIVNAVIVFAMFSMQARVRRTTRDSRTTEEPKVI